MATEQMANKDFLDMGVTVVGLIMSKNTYPSDKGTKFSLDIAVPKQRSMLSLGVEEAIWNSVEMGQKFKSLVTFSLYKGNLYLNALA